MSPLLARVLALDLGDVRVGLALSDPMGITAQPIGTMPRIGRRRDLARVQELCGEHEVGRVIIGNPLLLSGEQGERSKDAVQFAAQLRKRLDDIPVEMWDERLTTVEAERALISGGVRRGKRRKVVDTMAAILILQSYLDAGSSAGDPSLP